MRNIFTFLLLLLMPIVCVAHTLHIGEMSIPLHTTKYTTPSVNFLIDGDVWYLPMVKVEQQNTLHLSYKNDVYTVCRGAERKVGNHYFIGACLVGADDNVYLESTGTQYIDTGVVPDENTKMFIDMQDLSEHAVHNYMGINCGGGKKRFSILSFHEQNVFGAIIPQYRIVSSKAFDNLRHTFELSKTEGYVVDNVAYGDIYNFNIDTTCTIWIFNDHTLSTFLVGRVYKSKIFENDIPLRDFIPVPAGMQIGDFTVPENGMWDIVEQRFYGNDGTGEFTYGVDE